MRTYTAVNRNGVVNAYDGKYGGVVVIGGCYYAPFENDGDSGRYRLIKIPTKGSLSDEELSNPKKENVIYMDYKTYDKMKQVKANYG